MNGPIPGHNGHQAPHTFMPVGVGRHGLAVIEHLLGTGRWQLTAAVDRSAAAYARFQYLFHDRHIPFYTTVSEAFEAGTPDVVHIAATAPAHIPLAEAVLEAGYAGCLLIEKPITTNLYAADQFLTCLQSLPRDLRVAVNFNRRCSRLYQSAKAVVDSGELGRLKHIDFKRAMKLSMKGGHYIDLINWYMGARPRSVTAELASTSSVDTRGAFFYDPQGYVQIEYDSGQTACLDGLDKRSDLLEGMRLSFDQGVINVDVAERTTRLVGPHGERDLADESSSTTYDWIANTFEALVSPGGIFVPCSVVEAMDSLAVIVAAHRSHRLGGQPIALPLAPQARAEVLRLA